MAYSRSSVKNWWTEPVTTQDYSSLVCLLTPQSVCPVMPDGANSWVYLELSFKSGHRKFEIVDIIVKEMGLF